MGSFGIYVIIVTFIFVIYYVVMISLELFGTKGEKKDSVEVIHAGAPIGNAAPTAAPSATVKEKGDGKYSIEDNEHPEGNTEEVAGTDADVNKDEDPVEERAEPVRQAEQAALTAEDISDADIDMLAAQSKAKIGDIKQEFVNTAPTIQGAVYSDELEELCREARLKAEQENEQAEKLGL